MLKHLDEIRGLGGDVLVITLVPPTLLAPYLQRRAWPVLVLADPSLNAYRAFALGRTPWWTFLRPLVVARYLWHLLRGWRPEKPSGEEDLLQLGGDFVLDRNRRIVFAYRSKEPTDRPGVRELIDAVRALHS